MFCLFDLLLHEVIVCHDQEAVDCVKEMGSPGLMNVVVSSGINHTLEMKQEFRVVTGKLFGKLVQEKLLPQKQFLDG